LVPWHATRLAAWVVLKEQKVRIVKVAAILAGLALSGGYITSAHAGAFTYQSYGFSGENVHITDLSLGVNNEYGGAGLITLHGSSAIAAYCVDIADWLLGSGTYNSGINPASDPNLAGLSSFTGHSKIADIGALIANGSNGAAVQVAIWETEYGAAVTITPDDRNLQSVANSYFTDLQTLWTVPGNLSLMELTPAGGQTNQALVYMVAAPEPASMAILGSAMIALGYARKRRHAGRDAR
jgi:hypothetical protein